MTCTEITKWLNEYADGELADDIRHAVDEHLTTCLSCNRELKELRSLLDRARRLPVEIVPEAEIWPGIESRIGDTTPDDSPTRQAEEPSWALRRRFFAAAAVLVVALSIPLVLGPGPAGKSARSSFPVRPDQNDSIRDRPDTGSTAMLARLEDGAVLPRTDLLVALERQRDLLPPEVVSTIEENALLLDEAIAEVRLALIQKPNDRQLQLLLAARYQQEVALLERVNRV
jgi:hypothetical protein